LTLPPDRDQRDRQSCQQQTQRPPLTFHTHLQARESASRRVNQRRAGWKAIHFPRVCRPRDNGAATARLPLSNIGAGKLGPLGNRPAAGKMLESGKTIWTRRQ
jgi:hypothetical protein